jgi:hypothetical protein
MAANFAKLPDLLRRKGDRPARAVAAGAFLPLTAYHLLHGARR